MKNILLILTGGTICTALNEKGARAISEKQGLVLLEKFKNSGSVFASDVNFCVSENLMILSENITLSKWEKIISTYKKHISENEYDGVIIAHGTDTLAFSSALFSFLLSDTKIPVFFVSSNRPLGDKESNGNENFKYAVECIAKNIEPNVYAVYKNINDNRIYLHLGSRLEQCKNYSEDFYSVGAVDITDLSDEILEKISALYPKDKRKSFIDINSDIKLDSSVLFINAYPGIDYSAFDYSKFSAVLHSTYHSSTVCADEAEGENSVFYMIEKCEKLGVPIYFSPCDISGEIYESLYKLSKGNYKINFLFGTSNECSFAKLLLGFSCMNEEKRKEFLKQESNFERII